MTHARRAWALVALLCFYGGPGTAQEITKGRVTGLVFDSLSGRALPNAIVLARGGEAVDTTDGEGRYALTLLPGPARLTFEHERVSAWSLLRHEAIVDVVAGSVVEELLATASAGTVLTRACGAGADAVVGGTVRDLLTLIPIPGARVTARPSGSGTTSPTTVPSGENGEYFVCLSDGEPVGVDARLGSARSRTVSVRPPGSGVAVRDLFVPASEPAVLSGRVLDAETGRPLEGVTVQVSGSRLRAASRADGTFLLRGLPPGWVGLRVERIGYGSGESRIEAAGGDSVDITVELFAEAVEMSPMVVTVRGAAPEPVHTGSRFDGLDRPSIEKLLPRSIGFDDLLRNANVPGLKVRNVAFVSGLGVKTSGICVETSRRSTFSSDICEMVEVYLNGVRIPEAELFLENLAPGDIDRFQLLDPAEAGVRFAGSPRARNGVLLIYTRGR